MRLSLCCNLRFGETICLFKNGKNFGKYCLLVHITKVWEHKKII